MAKVKKAVVTKAKKVNGKNKKKKVAKPLKPKITARQIYEIIAETLQANSDGEFDVPSMIVRYLDKSHPKAKYGLHREFYIPALRELRFYPNTSTQAMTVYHNQASQVLPAFSEGVRVREVDLEPPTCSEHE